MKKTILLFLALATIFVFRKGIAQDNNAAAVRSATPIMVGPAGIILG